MPRSLALLAAALSLLAALPRSDARAEVPAVSEAITVELVNVDVRVHDERGRPIDGLGRDAFRVFEDGQPVAVSHFVWVPDAAGAAAGPGAAAPAEERAAPLHLAVLFDELQVGDRSRQALVAALRDRVATALRPGDRVSVSRFDGTDVQVLLQPTAERRRIDQALVKLGAFSPRRLMTGMQVRSALDWIAHDVVDDNCQNTGELLRIYAGTVLGQVRDSAGAVLRVAQRLALESGRKVLLHVSDGIPMIAGGEAYEYAIPMCDGTALGQGVAGAFNVAFDGADQESARDRFDPTKARLEFAEFSTAKLWTDVAARVNTLGVTIYALQAGDGSSRFLPGIDNATGGVSPEARQFARENARHTLAFVAKETGGLFLDAANVEGQAIGRMVGDLGGYYALAFTPAPAGRTGLRRIRVEVAAADRDASVRYRQSYRLQSQHERIADQLVALFDAERPENPLAVRLAVESKGEPPARSAQVSVPFDRLELLENAESARAGRLTFFVTMRKPGGTIVPVRSRTLDVALPPGDAGKPGAYTYRIDLPDGPAQIAVAVLDEFSGRLAFAMSAK